MNLNLDLPYSRGKIAAGKEVEKNFMTSINVINAAINQAYPEGFGGSGGDRRMFGRLQRKLDKIEVEETPILELEIGELDFLIKTIEKASMPVLWSKYVDVLEDALGDLRRESEAKPAAPAEEPIAE